MPRPLMTPQVLLAMLLIAHLQAAAGDTGGQFQTRHSEFVGTLSCASASCHGRPAPRHAPGGPQLQEYLHWMQGDPHAAAGRRMLEPRFQEVLKRASQQAGGVANTNVAGRCAQCHDPVGLAISPSTEPSILAQGIGCETCHGPGRRWLTAHYERDMSRQQLFELGMADTKNVVVRAELCASCHVGSAEKDVDHDMLVAGHPPLRFELASHQALIQRKHWDDSSHRTKEPDYELQLWAAGRVASAEAALSLLESRARRASESPSPGHDRAIWPELAEYNCFACHQPLRQTASRLPLEASPSRAPGVPPWQTWNFELIPAEKSFDQAIANLRAAMEGSVAPPPGEIVELARAAKAALSSRPKVNALSALKTSEDVSTWERSCHKLAAILAAGRTTEINFEHRLRRIAAALRFSDERYEWPAVFPALSKDEIARDTMSLPEIAAELEAMRMELSELRSTKVLSTEY